MKLFGPRPRTNGIYFKIANIYLASRLYIVHNRFEENKQNARDDLSSPYRIDLENITNGMYIYRARNL